MKTRVLFLLIAQCFGYYISVQGQGLKPILTRVNVQADTAKKADIIDNEWVAVGINRPYAVQYDYTHLFNGKPSYRFELKNEDNSLEGYAKGDTKGRIEFSYCYATHDDFASLPVKSFANAQKLKTVYHYGKGAAPQASSKSYTFSIYVPSDLPENVSSIFAQWHGMPNRTLVSTPEGEIKTLSTEEFIDLYDKMIFKKNIAHDKVEKKDKDGNVVKDKNGNIVYTAGKPNGWLVEQGGYPPLAFGFSKGYFYIKANSDSKWLTDKTDRNNADPTKHAIMEEVTSDYKTSTIAYKMPFREFPKDCWVTFLIDIDWTKYGKEANNVVKPGKLDVNMNYTQRGKIERKHIVNNQKILIGRNDDDGYYFKFGIYRVGSSAPVWYNLAGYKEHTK
ncbi:heparin lyase I family protein [Pseudopedobacter beijingensis]|uniref:Heparin lyase I family protein n=1 Tax=Pseudopedobacter beijingensis TaxID=1207056 RepID=A0ABW4IBZ2_9SPHI